MRVIEDQTVLPKIKQAWMRKMQITLTSKTIKEGNNTLVFGDTADDNPINFNINISGSKHLAPLKDNGVVTISNLEYDTIAKIMMYKYFIIEIKIGYGSVENMFTIFKGEVSYISQKIHSKHDTSTYITFASTMVASYSQKRINFNFNSGINIYAALNYIFRTNGNQKVDIDKSLKSEFLEGTINAYNSPATVISQILNQTGNSQLVTTADGSLSCNVFTASNVGRTPIILINPNIINITKGNPTIEGQMLSVTLLPIINFRTGDVIQIDNFLINTYIDNAESVPNEFKSNYIDRNGQYVIMEIQYTFQNRGDTFEYKIKARAKGLFRNILPGGR